MDLFLIGSLAILRKIVVALIMTMHYLGKLGEALIVMLEKLDQRTRHLEPESEEEVP